MSAIGSEADMNGWGAPIPLLTQIGHARAALWLDGLGLTLSIAVDFDDCLGKGLGGFLRQIVSNAAFDGPVGIFAREFLGVGARLRMWCTIGVTFEGDGGDADGRTCGKLPFQIVIFRLAFS